MWRTPALVLLSFLMSISLLQAQSVGDRETGLAAVYTDTLDGHLTASGQIYDKTKLTAAHKTLPYGTRLKLTNTKNKRSVIVRVNDRGPVETGRIIDISPAAAARLGFSNTTTREVTYEVMAVGSGKRTKQPSK
jgi:rare lipoprotein A